MSDKLLFVVTLTTELTSVQVGLSSKSNIFLTRQAKAYRTLERNVAVFSGWVVVALILQERKRAN